MPKNSRFPRPRAFLISLHLCLCVAVTAAPGQENGTESDFNIHIGTVAGEMAFDKTEFAVSPGSRVSIHFDNTDAMIHNLIVASERGGEEVYMEIARMVLALGSEADDREYVPESDLVLAFSRLLQPGESDTVTFTAPEETGPYPYVCTIPGHARTMNGIMHVAEEGRMPAAPAPESGFRELRYRYYEGQWSALPDFDQLEPVDRGRAPEDLITLEPRQREDYFGFVFEGELPVEAPGEYFFMLRSDDGSRLVIDGETVIDHDGLHGEEETRSAEIHLDAGIHDVRVEFFEHTVSYSLTLDWAGPGEAGLPPLSAGGRIPDTRQFHVAIADEPQIWRVLLPDAPARTLVVGLPGEVSFAFNPETASVLYGWNGPFLDRGGMVGNNHARGPEPVQVLGSRFETGTVDRPLRIGDPDTEPVIRFLGHSTAGGRAAVMYEVDGQKVTQTVEAVEPGAPALRYRFAFAEAPEAPVHFLVNGSDLELTSSAGQWNGPVLTVPAHEAQRFTVTLANRAD